MSYSHSECRALLRGEQRSKRFRYRDALPEVFRVLGIPESWIHYWIGQGQLMAKPWLGETWLRLEDVQDLLADPEALQEAFWATADPITSSSTAALMKERWPWLPKRMWRVAA